MERAAPCQKPVGSAHRPFIPVREGIVQTKRRKRQATGKRKPTGGVRHSGTEYEGMKRRTRRMGGAIGKEGGKIGRYAPLLGRQTVTAERPGLIRDRLPFTDPVRRPEARRGTLRAALSVDCDRGR